MDEVKDILKDFLDRIDHISFKSVAGQRSAVESFASDSGSQRSAEPSQRSSFSSSKISIFQVIKLIQ